MAGQTAALFHALRDGEAIDLLVELLRAEEANQSQLVDASGLPQPTASRYLKELEAVGVVRRERTTGPYRVVDAERTRRLLDEATGLVLAILDSRKKDEERLQRRVRRTRVDVVEERPPGSA